MGSRPLSREGVFMLTITADVSTLTIKVAFTFLSAPVLRTVAVVKVAAVVVSVTNMIVKGCFNKGCGRGTRLVNKVVLILLKVEVLVRRLSKLTWG